MRIAAVLGLFVAFVAAPVLAEDGNVSQDTLKALGLGEPEVLSDAQGMEIRGMSSSAAAFGASLLFAQLSDSLGNFILASDLNGGLASDENAGLSADSLATQGPQGSSIAISLTAGPFAGTVLGNAGNAANIGAAGLSAATGN